MKHQSIILAGIVTWLTGCFLDAKVVQYAYTLIIIGTLISCFGAVGWLQVKENRARLKDALKPKGDLIEMVKQAFDFRWKRISIIWAICAFGGMLIVHLGAVTMKNTDAYKCAVQAIKQDKNVIEQVGEIVDFSYVVSGHATTGNGYSEFNLGVIGTKGSVRVNAVVEGHSGSYIAHKISLQE